MGPEAAQVRLDQQASAILSKIVRSKTVGSSLQSRAQIVVAAFDGLTNRAIAKHYQLEEHRISQWRTRWVKQHEQWKLLDPKLRPAMSAKLVRQWLADNKGRGRKSSVTDEQKVLILALACEPPSKSGYPHTHWNDRLLAKEVSKRGIASVSNFCTWRFIKKTTSNHTKADTTSNRTKKTKTR